MFSFLTGERQPQPPLRSSHWEIMEWTSSTLSSSDDDKYILNGIKKLVASATSAIHTTSGQFLQSVTTALLSHLPSPAALNHIQHRAAISKYSYSSSSVSDSLPYFPVWTGQGRLYPSFLMSSPIGDMSTSVTADKLKKSPQSGGRGPIFLGHVYTMVDDDGNGLVVDPDAESLLRVPKWIKKMLPLFNKNENKNPVCKFFMDLGDAAAYVNRFNLSIENVGSASLESAYECCKEEPRTFKLVPNAKQVKEANKLLKENETEICYKKLDGVPVFSAQNLCIAVATDDGIKWCTPYFFEKELLDSILEASVDQHFHAMIQNRRGKRRQDVIEDGPSVDAFEDNGESLFEPPEVQEVLDEMGHPSIPLSVLTKVAEIQFLDVADEVLLGNKWLRKAIGIQPKFPYLVDSFEARSAVSVLKATDGSSSNTDTSSGLQVAAPYLEVNEHAQDSQRYYRRGSGFQFPFGSLFSDPWLKPPSRERQNENEASRSAIKKNDNTGRVPSDAFLPFIIMICIINSQSGKKSRIGMKRRMARLSKELEESGQKAMQSSEDRDPLFVANVGEYSTMTMMRSA